MNMRSIPVIRKIEVKDSARIMRRTCPYALATLPRFGSFDGRIQNTVQAIPPSTTKLLATFTPSLPLPCLVSQARRTHISSLNAIKCS